MLHKLGFAAVLTAAATTVAAQDLTPPPDALQAAVAAQLDPWWSMAPVDVVAQVNLGDAVDPRYRMRLQADATLGQTLYTVDRAASGALQPFVVVIETADAGLTRTLFATAEASYRAGSWDIQVEVENPPSQMGAPEDSFPGPVVLAGSEEMLEIRRRLDECTAMAAEIEAERARRAAELEAEVTQIAADYARAADEVERQHAAALAELEAEVTRLAADYARAADAAARRHEAALAELEADQARLLDRLATDQQAALDALIAQQEAARAELEAATAGGREALEAAAAAAALEADIDAVRRLADLERQRAEAATALGAAQAATLTAAAEARREALARLQATLTTEDPAARRTAFAEALTSGDWSLERAALSAILQTGPVLGFEFGLRPAENEPLVLNETQVFRISEFDATTGNFGGTRQWYNGSEGIAGSVNAGGLSIADRWCQFALRVTETGTLEGPMDCGNDNYIARVTLY